MLACQCAETRCSSIFEFLQGAKHVFLIAVDKDIYQLPVQQLCLNVVAGEITMALYDV